MKFRELLEVNYAKATNLERIKIKEKWMKENIKSLKKAKKENNLIEIERLEDAIRGLEEDLEIMRKIK